MRRSDATFKGIEVACMETLCTRVNFIKFLKVDPERRFSAFSDVGPGGDIDIYLDLERAGLVRGVLHELLHQVLDDHMEWASPSVRELFIQEMEDAIIKKVIPWKRYNEWRAEIRKHIRKGLHNLP